MPLATIAAATLEKLAQRYSLPRPIAHLKLLGTTSWSLDKSIPGTEGILRSGPLTARDAMLRGLYPNIQPGKGWGKRSNTYREERNRHKKTRAEGLNGARFSRAAPPEKVKPLLNSDLCLGLGRRRESGGHRVASSTANVVAISLVFHPARSRALRTV
jgi:hypothetical protein